ncbi:HEAT repeat domain-containing protein [Streptomyces bobili]|uniref:HEAT repeat domain-containing protein n=1 Tax=Streptomyces bobili TaxID=67280 RepID=UPI0036F0E872
MRDLSNDGQAGDPRRDYAEFLQREARQAGLGAREISERFAWAARQEAEAARDAASSGTAPYAIADMAHSKSHIDRLFKAQAYPNPPWPFTLQFLRVTSRAAGLTAEEHHKRCVEARSLLQAIADMPALPATRSADMARSGEPGAGDDDTVAVLRLRSSLEEARHTETRLRHALKDTQFLMTTLWRITGVLRDIIITNDALEARASRSEADPAEIESLRDKTQEAFAHQRIAHQEIERATDRIRTLELLWEQARTDAYRLSLHSDNEDTATGPWATESPIEQLLPEHILAQPGALDDIADALRKAQALNTREDDTIRDLQRILSSSEVPVAEDELPVLLVATRLTDDFNRNLAVTSLLRKWPHHPETRRALIRLTHDHNQHIRTTAVEGLVEGWPTDTAVRDALLRLAYDDSSSVLFAAAKGLTHAGQGDAATRDTLLHLVHHKDLSVSVVAAEGLVEGWPGDTAIREVLLNVIREDERGTEGRPVTAAAVGLAKGWPGDAAIRDVLLNVIREDEGGTVKVSATAAAFGLAEGWPGDPAVRDVLLGLSTGYGTQIRTELLQALAAGWPGDIAVRSALVRFALSDGTVAALQVLAQGWAGDTYVRDILLQLLNRTLHQIRIAAVQSLAEQWAGDATVREALLPLTDDADTRIREAVARALAEGWPKDPDVRDAFIRLSRDRDGDVRKCSAQALARNWPDDSGARDSLLLLARDSNRHVRAAAARGLPRDNGHVDVPGESPQLPDRGHASQPSDHERN